MLIKLTVAAVLRALSLCGMGGFLTYIHRTDIEKLENQWRRKTLPQPSQDSTSQDTPRNTHAQDEKTVQPSYKISYEVYEQHHRVHIPTNAAIPSPPGFYVQDNINFANPYQVTAYDNYNWAHSASSGYILLVAVACFLAGCVASFCVHHLWKSRKRPAQATVLEPHATLSTTSILDALWYRTICTRLDQLETVRARLDQLEALHNRSQHEVNSAVLQALQAAVSELVANTRGRQRSSLVMGNSGSELYQANGTVTADHVANPQSFSAPKNTAETGALPTEAQGKATARAEGSSQSGSSASQTNEPSPNPRVSRSNTVPTGFTARTERHHILDPTAEVSEDIQEAFEEENSQPAPGMVGNLVRHWAQPQQ